MADFIATTDWSNAQVRPLAGDASNRRYMRLHRGDGTTAVLMDAPPEKGEDIRPFVQIALHLQAAGLAPPAVFAKDEEQGFLVLEDLGDGLFARHLESHPQDEITLYRAAVDVLLKLADAPAPAGVGPYDAQTMAALAGLAGTWYAGNSDAAQRIEDAAKAALTACPEAAPVLVLRDYHAENLLWRPDRVAPLNVGLLDFQDALMGHPAYDLASLIKDARRDVTPKVQEAAIAHYVAQSGWDRATLDHALAAQSAQRNLRILGVFARLSLAYGKPGYVDLIPRVWAHLLDDLTHPALTDLRAVVQKTLPTPSAALLADLASRSGTMALS